MSCWPATSTARWPVDVTRRVLTNGSIYIEMAQLSAGQELLLSLPDETMAPTPRRRGDGARQSLAATFARVAPPSDDELRAQWELLIARRRATRSCRA